MQIVELENNPGCIVLVGDIDREECSELHRAIRRLVERGHHDIAIDFSQVTFLDSAGVAQLVFALGNVPSTVTVRISATSRPVRRIFGVLGFSRLLPPEEEAIDASKVLRRRLFDPYVRTA